MIKKCKKCGKPRCETISMALCYDCFKKWKSDCDKKHREKYKKKLLKQKRDKYYSGGKYICKECGKEFRRGVKRSFCSKNCAYNFWKRTEIRKEENNPMWKNGSDGGTIKKRYKEYLEKRGYNPENMGCEICKITNAMAYDLHHIVFRSEMPNHPELHNPRNIIYICRSCHSFLHGSKRKAREEIVKKRNLEELFNTKLL